MLVSRSYRNNLGYQIDIDRPHPIWKWELERYNKNHYHYDGYNTKMIYHKGSEKGMQYGGRLIKGEKRMMGKGIDPMAVYKALQLLYTGAKAVSKFYSSETGTVIKNTYGKFMNSNPNWRSGFAGEKHMLTKKGITYNYMGPGTALKERLQRGDPPLDGPQGLDQVAKIHDIDYSNAKSFAEVRVADKKFIKGIEA